MSTHENYTAVDSDSDASTESQVLMEHGIRRVLTPPASSFVAAQAKQYDQPIQEIQDVLRAIKDCMDAVYNATISRDEEKNDCRVAKMQQHAYKNAIYITRILKYFGRAMIEIEHDFGTLGLRDINTETAELIVASTTQALTSLVPLERSGPLPLPEIRAIVNSLTCKYYTQIGLELERISKYTWRFSDKLVRAGELETAIYYTISSFQVMGVPYNDTENIAAALQQLITRYVHSLAAVNGTAEQMAKVYLVFANEKLEDLLSKQLKESGPTTLYEELCEFFGSWKSLFGMI